MQAAQLAHMQIMVQSMYLQTQTQMSGYGSPKASAHTPGPIMPAAGASSDPEYDGSLKSLSSRNGYGFIHWPENHTKKWYTLKHGDKETARDVYISSDLLPEGGKEIGANLKFTVSLNSKGHPQAKTCRLA
jgi:hypothetical protein